MTIYLDEVLGVEVRTTVLSVFNVDKFQAWLSESRFVPVAVDTETTGLDIFAAGNRLRMVQFGTKREAWVVPVEVFGGQYVHEALSVLTRLVAHNAPFDALVLNRWGYDGDKLLADDTAIMAHLLDPRAPEDGGVGQGLKPLAEHYIDPSLSDGDKALKEWARKNKVKQEDRFRVAPINLPELEHYAGLDCILTAGLYELLKPMVEGRGMSSLYDFEMALQRVTTRMMARGILVDAPYAQALREYLLDEEDKAEQFLMAQGIDNPNSTKQVREALLRAGVTLVEKTPSGEFSVSADALALVDHPAVEPLKQYKMAQKFRTSYVDAILSDMDEDGRVHPFIRSLKARTARMSVSAPPLHQLPSSDALIRRILVADPGHTVFACDYSQVELRVLAELAGERNMLEAIARGVDLHTNTAEKTGLTRKVAKMTNFLIVYGGGAGKLALSAGITFKEAQAALKAFHRAFPRVRRYGNRLQERSGHGERPVVTPSGRQLPLDKDRTYAAVNYTVQSTARDVLAEAMLEVDEDPAGSGIWLPVHDELVGQAPSEQVDEVAARVAGLMSTDFGSVRLDTDAEVYGPSWGHGYYNTLEDIPQVLRRFF